MENRKRPTLWRFPKVQVISHHGQITGAADAEETEENERLGHRSLPTQTFVKFGRRFSAGC